MGSYCEWPKREPRKFVLTDKYNAYPGMMPRKAEIFPLDLMKLKPIKFYQKLNRKK